MLKAIVVGIGLIAAVLTVLYYLNVGERLRERERRQRIDTSTDGAYMDQGLTERGIHPVERGA